MTRRQIHLQAHQRDSFWLREHRIDSLGPNSRLRFSNHRLSGKLRDSDDADAQGRESSFLRLAVQLPARGLGQPMPDSPSQGLSRPLLRGYRCAEETASYSAR